MQKITLKAARINAGKSQFAASEAVNVSEKTLSNWELGKTFPPADKFLRLCQFYQVEMTDIFLPE